MINTSFTFSFPSNLDPKWMVVDVETELVFNTDLRWSTDSPMLFTNNHYPIDYPHKMFSTDEAITSELLRNARLLHFLGLEPSVMTLLFDGNAFDIFTNFIDSCPMFDSLALVDDYNDWCDKMCGGGACQNFSNTCQGKCNWNNIYEPCLGLMIVVPTVAETVLARIFGYHCLSFIDCLNFIQKENRRKTQSMTDFNQSF